MNPPSKAMEGRPFNFPVVLLRQQFHDSIFNKYEPIFYFKDDDYRMDGRYAAWLKQCNAERECNQRPVSAKERAESSFAKPMEDGSTFAEPMVDKQPQ